MNFRRFRRNIQIHLQDHTSRNSITSASCVLALRDPFRFRPSIFTQSSHKMRTSQRIAVMGNNSAIAFWNRKRRWIKQFKLQTKAMCGLTERSTHLLTLKLFMANLPTSASSTLLGAVRILRKHSLISKSCSKTQKRSRSGSWRTGSK